MDGTLAEGARRGARVSVAPTVTAPIAQQATSTTGMLPRSVRPSLMRISLLPARMVIVLHICLEAVFGPLNPGAEIRPGQPGREKRCGENDRRKDNDVGDHWLFPKKPRT